MRRKFKGTDDSPFSSLLTFIGALKDGEQIRETESASPDFSEYLSLVDEVIEENLGEGTGGLPPGGRRLHGTDKRGARLMGICVRTGPHSFERRGRFGDGLDKDTVDRAIQSLGLGDVCAHTYYGQGQARLRDVAASFPGIVRAAVVLKKSSDGGPSDPPTVRQLMAPVPAAQTKQAIAPVPSRAGKFRPALNEDCNIAFLLKIESSDLAVHASGAKTEEMDDRAEALLARLHQTIVSTIENSRQNSSFSENSFAPERLAYRGGADRVEGGEEEEGEFAKVTKQFGEDLHQSQVEAKLKEAKVGELVLHFVVTGVGLTGSSEEVVTAQEAFRHLKTQVNDSPLKPIGRSARVIYAANVGDPAREVMVSFLHLLTCK